MNRNRSAIRKPAALISCAGVLLVACPDASVNSRISGAKASGAVTSPTGPGSADPGVVGAGITGSDTTATKAPTGTPRPTEAPTATPTITPQGEAKVLSVKVSPATASITVKPAATTATPLYPTNVQLAAEVFLSNSLATDSVTWSTTATTTAVVSASGLVTVGSVPGKAYIVATSVQLTPEGQKATGSCEVTVNADGAAAVTLK